MGGRPTFPAGPPTGAPPPGWRAPDAPPAPPLDGLPPPATATAAERRGWSGVEVVVLAVVGLLVGLLLGVILGTRLADDGDERGLGSGDEEAVVGFGTAQAIGAGWTLRVAAVDPDAGEQIAELREQNEPPGPNESYLLVTIELSYAPTGSQPAVGDPQTVLLSVVDDRGEQYHAFQRSCGYFPNPIFQYGPLVDGETIEANQCWAVPTDRVDGMVMFAAALTGDPAQAFALR